MGPFHPAKPRTPLTALQRSQLGCRGPSLSPGWAPQERLVGPLQGPRALVAVHRATTVDSVEWTLFSESSPQVWVDMGPFLDHHCHRTTRKHTSG